MFPVRYGLSSYINLLRNSVFKELICEVTVLTRLQDEGCSQAACRCAVFRCSVLCPTSCLGAYRSCVILCRNKQDITDFKLL
jgi:hypothetical protein